MPRHLEGMMVPNKIRKRGCSSSSSSSSRIHSRKAILRGKNRAGLGIALGRSRSSTPVPTWKTTAIESPKLSQSGKSTRPVSARRLAATLWEMNEMPSPKIKDGSSKKNGNLKKDKTQLGSGWALHSGSGLSYSPSETGSRRRTPSRIAAGALDSTSHASFMEIETRSLHQTSVNGSRSQLKDVSNALTTSKELLKIITRIWGQSDYQPSSSTTSLITALHSELERARLDVNRLIQEQRADKNEISYIMKCLAEEKAAWKSKEQQVVEAAVASIAGELEVERKLRQRIESLNKKLGKELSEVKTSLLKVVKDLESEKRAREITEQVCEELARNIDEVAENEESNSAIGKLRKQMEGFLRTHIGKDEEGSIGHEDDEKVEDDADRKEGSEESDLLELNMDNKGQKWGYGHADVTNEIRTRNSVLDRVTQRSGSLLRSVSDGVESLDRDVVYEAPRRSYNDGTQRNKSIKGGSTNVHKLSSSRLSLSQKNEQLWPSRDPLDALNAIRESHCTRRSKW